MASAADESSPSRQLRVTALSETDTARWEAFVEACPEATFFHRPGWKTIIEKVFRHPTWYLQAEAVDGQLEGILPLARVKSRLFGDALVSLPFGVYGGIAAVSERAAAALDEAAVSLAEALGVGHMEYRHCRRRFPERPYKPIYYTFRGDIHEDPDANLKAIPRKQRAMVRKGIDAGLGAEMDADTDRFFDTFARSVRRLGTPVFPRRYFRALRETFGDDCEVLTVTRGGQVLTSVLSFYFRDEVLPFYGGGTDEARRYYANDFMYWAVMERARERGCRVFDYGRSKVDTGSYRFKKHWGFEPQPLYYECRLVRASVLPDNSPLNPKYRAFIAAWKRLPLPVANLIGPRLARSLG